MHFRTIMSVIILLAIWLQASHVKSLAIYDNRGIDYAEIPP
jgi:hypothetical protein